MKTAKYIMIVLVISMLVLTGCQKEEGAQLEVPGDGDPAAWNRSGELDGMNALALGTLVLEDSDDAVAPEQAVVLLPLWEVLQSGGLKNQSESDAVLKQIEGNMTDAQMASIEEMALTREDMTTWMNDQGMEMPQFGGGAGTGTGAGRGGFGQLGDMSEEDRAAMREQFQAMRDMTPEEREKKMAELGIEMPEGAGEGMPGGGAGGALGGNLMLRPLIDLLTVRAGE